MNKNIFSVYKGLESGALRNSDKKVAGNFPVDFASPASPKVPAGESNKIPAKWTYERFQEAKLGEIAHEALSRVKSLPADFSRAETAVKELWSVQGRWFNLEEAVSRLNGFLSAPSIARFFPENAEILNEKEFCDSSGKLYRMDKVILMAKEVWVVDFKTGLEVKDHSKQLKKYISILKELHKNKKVRGFVLRIIDKEVEEII